jgi:hypothetical protein
MANDNTQNSTAAMDVVAVLDEDLNQVFPDARPIKASFTEDSKQMEHPLETGVQVTDHRVIQPIEIVLTCMLVGEEYRQVYRTIKDIFIRGDKLTVQSRVESYPSMIVLSIPHEEPPDIQDGAMMIIKLREALFVEAQFTDIKPVKAAASKNAGTTKRGEQKATETPPARRQSTLAKAAEALEKK